MVINLYEFNSHKINIIKNCIYKSSSNAQLLSFIEVDDLLRYESDVCFVTPTIFKKYKTALKEKNRKFVFIGDNPEEIMNLMIAEPGNYCLRPEPSESEMVSLMEVLMADEKKKYINVKIPHGGTERIKLNDLTYINIVSRSLTYHLIDDEIQGLTVRTSFEAAIKELLAHEELYFVKPTLLINLSNIQRVYADRVEFNGGECLYIPKTASEALKEAWLKFNQ